MGTPSRKLTFDDAVVVWLMHCAGRFNHEIASEFQCNQGRISEILNGKLHNGSRAIADKKFSAFGKNAPPVNTQSDAAQLSLGISEE